MKPSSIKHAARKHSLEHKICETTDAAPKNLVAPESDYIDALVRGSSTRTLEAQQLNTSRGAIAAHIVAHSDVHNDDSGPPHTDGHIDTGPDPHDDGYIDNHTDN